MKSNTTSTSNWIETSIDDIKADEKAAIAIGPFGSRMKSDCYVDSGIPVIRGTNLTGGRTFEGEFVFITKEKADELSSCNVREGDLVFPHRGSIGEVGIVPNDKRYVMSTSLMKLTCDKSKAKPLFLFYYFKSPTGRHELLKNSSQVGTPGIGQPLTSLKAIRLILPPIQEQSVIVHILGMLDDKIELNRKMNQTLEAMARSIFKSWFVDFDPVRAKAEGRDPGLPPDLAALFPDSFEDSELGEIPKGWKIKTIADLAELNGWTLSKSDNLERIEYIEISEVSKGNIGTIQVFQRGEEPSRARRRLRHGDTVLSTVRPDRGSYFLCLNPPPSLVASTGFAVFTPTNAPWSLLHAALTQSELFEHLGHLADGGAYPAVRPEVIAQSQLPWPSNSDVTEAFHRICGPLYEKAEQQRGESRILADLRDVLLPKLLSGEMSVKNVEKFAGVAI